MSCSLSVDEERAARKLSWGVDVGYESVDVRIVVKLI